MADLIRDAIVRIAIEQPPANLAAPDLANVLAAFKQVEAEVGKAIKHTEAIATAAAKQTEAAAKVQAEAARLASEEMKRAAEAAAKAQESAADRARAAVERQREATLRAADALKQAGEGAFIAARGIAFMFASSDENFQAALRTIAAFQGAFDVFKGGTDLIKGTYTAYKSLQVAAEAAAAANALNATAVGATGAAAASATPFMAAFAVATGPIGLAIAGIAAVLSVAAAAWKMFADAARNAADIQRMNADAIRDWTAANDDAVRSQRERIEASRLTTTEAIAGAVGKEQGRANILQERLNSGAYLATSDVSQQDQLANTGRAALDSLERAARLQKDAIGLEKERLTAAKELNKAKEELIVNQQRATDEARKALEVENQRVQSIQAQIGQLSELEKAELKRLSAKAQSGERLTNDELRRAQQLGGDVAKDFVDKQFAARGAGDAAGIAAGFGVDLGAKQKQAQERAASEDRRLAQLTDGRDPAAVLGEIRTQRDEAIAAAEAAIAAQQAVFDKLGNQQDAILKRLDEIEAGRL